jgi:NADPH2:quinone reductase
MRAYVLEVVDGPFREAEIPTPSPAPITYSGIFTLFPLLSRLNREHHGMIRQKVNEMVETGKLKPLLAKQQFAPDQIASAFDLVSTGTAGKVTVEF